MLANNIRYLRKKNNYSQEFIAEKLGYKTYTTIQKWETGVSEPSIAKLKEFADLVGVDVNDIINTNMENKDLSFLNISNIYPVELKKFPLLGEIACGEPRFASEDRESYVEASTDIKADFCLKARGDSMINARIQDGDIVFVQQQEVVENGEIAVVIIDNEATLKRVFYYSDKELFILKAENPAYEDLIFTHEELKDIHILGKAVIFQSFIK